MNNREAKKIFEEHFRECSDSTWYKTKRVFTEDFPMNRENLIKVAQIKSMLPKFDICTLDIIQTIKFTNMSLGDRLAINGKDFLELLKKHDINIHKNTLTNWFRKLEGFSQRRTYTYDQMTPVLLAAFTWKLKNQLKELKEPRKI